MPFVYSQCQFYVTAGTKQQLAMTESFLRVELQTCNCFRDCIEIFTDISEMAFIIQWSWIMAGFFVLRMRCISRWVREGNNVLKGKDLKVDR